MGLTSYGAKLRAVVVVSACASGDPKKDGWSSVSARQVSNCVRPLLTAGLRASGPKTQPSESEISISMPQSRIYFKIRRPQATSQVEGLFEWLPD
jgi:hypothetical protein